MEEDSAAKAPVTRLRRRLSTEVEERASTPNTPTKKRTTRRAKPELDLIDENATTPLATTPQKKNLRKITKDTLEPVEEKTITPSRRSTRIKSNTSILSESAVIVAVDSPRARRAARRNSQLGSDSESIITPSRATRRTRKDSTSSIDKGDIEIISVVQVDAAIEEEPETDLRKSVGRKSTGNEKNKSPYNLRKSPMPNEKLSKENTTPITIQSIDNQNESSNLTISSSTTENSESLDKNNAIKLSESNINLISNLDIENRYTKNHLNKSTSILESNNFKSKKKRTKSWSIISSPNPKDTDFFSDNDSKKNKLEAAKSTMLCLKNKTSGDSNLNANESVKNKGKHQMVFKDCSVVLSTPDDVSMTIHKMEQQQHLSSEDLFNNKPTGVLKPVIIIEDSDSNSDRVPVRNYSTEDQCVPVVSVPVILNDSSAKQENKSTNNLSQLVKNNVQNDSVEPMDIDETIPDHIILQESGFTKSNQSQLNENTKVEDKNNISKRKSSLSQSLNKTENKSTLILTEIKDLSSNEISKTETSQIITNKSISKSMVDLDKTQNNEMDRKNVSVTCLTSTPLQQKNFQKLVAPINTSIIKLNQDTIQSPSLENTSKHSNKSKNDASDSSDLSEEVSLKEEIKLLNNEASDAGDDYESGDSRDEDERRNEKENEIIDKGVTLTSDEELSNDTDYEKDSFVVSSDEEDYQLLDGTSDDLSMSDNELKMTSKSKKKFDERMAKQQKKASREMFAARHKQNNSKSKQVNKIDDDSSCSDDVPAKQRKGNRMRLDSSQETSILSNENTKKAAKKTKRLSDSVWDRSVFSEKEITMQNESLQGSDPLATQIKDEPKTPKVDMNSTLDFVDAKDANNTKMNETVGNENITDPLHTSNQEDFSSSDSDTNNIIENYDSILNSLNKGNKKKTHDMSLNIERVYKEKNKKAPVIDELNLTQVKSTKKSKKVKENTEKDINNSQTLNKSSNNQKQNDPLENSNKKSKKLTENGQKKHNTSKEVNNPFDDSSSNSIDLHLLFSEDSNSGSMNIKSKNGDNDGIPLKHSIAKTDIRANSDVDEADGNVSYFIDTQGDYGNDESIQKDTVDANKSIDHSLNSSSKKSKNKSLSQFIVNEDLPNERMIENDGNTSNIKTPKSERKTKKRMSQKPEDCEIDPVQEQIEENVSMSQTQLPKSDKKKKRLSKTQADGQESAVEIIYDENASIADEKTPKSKKNKQNKLSQSNTDYAAGNPEVISHKEDNITVSSVTPTSEKKKNKKLAVENSADTLKDEETGDISILKTPKSDKKKKKRESESQVNVTTVGSEELQGSEDCNASVAKTPRDKKMKHRLSNSHEDEVAETLAEEIVNKDVDTSNTKSPKSDKKKKKRHTESLVDITTDKEITKVVDDLDLNTSNNITPNSKNKINKNHLPESKTNNAADLKENSDSECPEEVAIQMHQPNAENDNEESKKSSAKKKKKKKNRSQTNTKQETSNDDGDDTECSTKKRKRQHAGHEMITQDMQVHLHAVIQEDKNKKRKISNNEEVSLEPDVVKKSNTKKRKHREDEEMVVSKVRKTNNLEKMPVPRLPSSIISQLDDVPKQTKKKQRIIATSQFLVEDSRRNKPSNYLEESIYLNEDSPKKKPKSNIPKPKVLPTMPTASSSNTGYTTNFKVNVIPTETKFVVQMNNIGNFKEDRFYNKNIKRMGTYEMYKKQRNIKLSKF